MKEHQRWAIGGAAGYDVGVSELVSTVVSSWAIGQASITF
jgi:hypothetical protein